jgi:hypothetical protein
VRLLDFPQAPALKEEESPRQRSPLALGCIFLCALAAVVPLIARGNSFGHDFDFHLLSWMETAKQWHEGVAYPHWIESANYGAGEPRFVFYPPASWVLGALLGTLTSWTATPILFILLSLCFSGVSLYSLAREYMPCAAATLAACIYAINPYALFNAYERAAYGELLAGVWMPLILLFALRRRSSIAPLGLAIAAIWLTNAPAAVMACYTLAGVAVVSTIIERKAWPLVRAAGGGLLGLGLASFYLVPAAYERRWVQIARAIGAEMRVEDSFLFAHAGEPFHLAVLRKASWIAVTLLAISTTALVLAWKRRVSRSRNSDASMRTLIAASTAITVVVLFLLLPVSELVWRFAPEMRFLQFPWRWLLVESVVMAVLAGYAFHSLQNGPSHRRILRWVAAASCVVLVVGAEMFAFYQPEDEDDTLASQVAAFRSGAGVEGTDEYTPANADNSAIQKNLPQVRPLRSPEDELADSSTQTNSDYQRSTDQLSGQVTVDRWQSERKVMQVTTNLPGFAVLRLMDYPGWHVLVNSSEHTLRPHREDGLMAVPIPTGTSRIEVRWRPTRDAVWGRVATFAALFLLMPVALLERKKSLATQV